MLLILTELNFRIVEKEWWIGGCIFLSGENNFLCLSSLIGLNTVSIGMPSPAFLLDYY